MKIKIPINIYGEDFRNIFYSILMKDGFVYFENIPRNFQLIPFLKESGTIFPQYNGAELWYVRPHWEHLDAATSVGAAEISFHSEFYERKGVPPSHIALFCKRSAENGGEFRLLDAYKIIEKLPKSTLTALREEKVYFSTFSSVGIVSRGESCEKPVLSVHSSGRVIVQYSSRWLLKSNHKKHHEFVDAVKKEEENHIFVKQKPNSLIVWDNFRFFHSRTKFEDQRRLLLRVCMSYY